MCSASLMSRTFFLELILNKSLSFFLNNKFALYLFYQHVLVLWFLFTQFLLPVAVICTHVCKKSQWSSGLRHPFTQINLSITSYQIEDIGSNPGQATSILKRLNCSERLQKTIVNSGYNQLNAATCFCRAQYSLKFFYGIHRVLYIVFIS